MSVRISSVDVDVRSERWSPRTGDLTLPERVAWVLGDEDGRPLSSLTEPAGLIRARLALTAWRLLDNRG